MSEPKLLSCPFCGGEARLHSDYEGTWAVSCPKCGCRTLCYTDKITAPVVWNRRVKGVDFDTVKGEGEKDG